MAPCNRDWVYSAWTNHTRRGRTIWKSITENRIEQQQEQEQEEENYITDIYTIGDEEEEGNISEQNKSVEDIMNNSEEIDDQMWNIIVLVRDAIYKDVEIN